MCGGKGRTRKNEEQLNSNSLLMLKMFQHSGSNINLSIDNYYP